MVYKKINFKCYLFTKETGRSIYEQTYKQKCLILLTAYGRSMQ